MSEILHERVEWAVEDHVARITLIRESGNALDHATGLAVRDAADRVARGAADGSIRVAVLAARGSTFCVGGDLRDFTTAEDPGQRVAAVAGDLHRAILTLRSVPIPVVAVVHGTVAGGGIGLALAADIVLMAAEATMRLAYTAVGLSPDCGATWMLTRRLGAARTLDLAFTNRPLTGTEAAASGLISRAVPGSELTDTAEDLITALANGSASSFAETKRLVELATHRDLAAQLDDEAATIAALITGPDGVEGTSAFLAKRAPRFR